MKKRSESFFGIHSDFHAKPQEGLVIGATLSEEDIRAICETIRPDFIQIDCKGHPGWASYPSACGNAMPQMAGDPLALWRRVTREYGVALYMHYSGVYEVKYCAEHPDESALQVDGTPSTSVRMDSRYFEEYFMPQIGELAEKYGVDGVWIDGDCWSVVPDYHSDNIEKFEKEIGVCFHGKPPAKPSDPYYDLFLEYTRRQFRETLRFYVDALHEKYPNLQICSNWAFSDHMPEAVSANVDFLSGDLNPRNCLNSARYAGRMLAGQNMPWDLMSWGFRYRIYNTSLIPPKHSTQIMQEAASVIALGGAYQDNIPQFTDGAPNVKQICGLKPLADFMRAREPYCFKGKAIPQAAMLVSTYDRYREMTKPFSREGMEKHMGLTALLCDSGVSLEIISEHVLESKGEVYPLLIVPELYEGLEDKTVAILKAYAKNGGNLLLVGASTCRFFAERGFGFDACAYTELPDVPGWANCNVGHNLNALSENVPSYFSVEGDDLGVTVGACSILPKEAKSDVFGTLVSSLRMENPAPFANAFPFGKGRVCAIGMDLGTQYHNGMQYLHRKLMDDVVHALYTPLVSVKEACGILEIVCLEKEGRRLIQLVNANGNHANDRMVTESFVSPVLDIMLELHVDAEPKALILQPEGTELSFTYENGCARVAIPRVDIHEILEIVAE